MPSYGYKLAKIDSNWITGDRSKSAMRNHKSIHLGFKLQCLNLISVRGREIIGVHRTTVKSLLSVGQCHDGEVDFLRVAKDEFLADADRIEQESLVGGRAVRDREILAAV